MMDKDAASLLPKVAVLVLVVHQSITRVTVLTPQSRASGDHLHAGEMPRRPAPLLRLGPIPRAAVL